MVRIQARWLACRWLRRLLVSRCARRRGASTPRRLPADASTRGPSRSTHGEDPDPTQALRAEAMTLFGRLDDDRASVWVASGGGPDARRIVSCPNLFARIEVWTYLTHRLLGTNVRMLFFPEPGTGISRYWTVIDGESVLLAPKSQADKPLDALDESAFGCADTGLVQAAYRAISSRQGDTAGGLRERAALAVPLSGPTASAPAGAPAPLVLSAKKLSGKERKQALAALPDRYRQFLSDVEPILDRRRGGDVPPPRLRLPAGPLHRGLLEAALGRLRRAESRVQGHLRAETPDGQGAVPERQHRPGADLPHQRPARRLPADRLPDIYNPIELWYYERLETLRMSKVTLLFYQPFGTGDYRLWTPLEGPQALLVGGIAGLAGIGPAERSTSRAARSGGRSTARWRPPPASSGRWAPRSWSTT